MAARLIRISSRRTGERRWVRVYVYDTHTEMVEAAARFNGVKLEDACRGVTQAYQRERYENNKWRTVQSLLIIRLERQWLGTATVTHEINHAATAIYGSTLTPDIRAVEVLDNANETLAYLQSDLTRSLVDRLYALGTTTMADIETAGTTCTICGGEYTSASAATYCCGDDDLE